VAQLCRDPQFVLERHIAQLRAEAAERGEPLPLFYRIEFYGEPTTIKQSGRMRRKQAEKARSL
jgi:hypothetical protein